ncbi:MAG: hypothetical protein QOK10_1016 [Pseudonocardiales bacterium]|nr:hypothetical protein [Pseudonocardiales bacterium]
MRVAAIQHDIVWQDAAATRKHVEPMIEQAASSGARLIVLSEMFATGFSMEPERIAEDPGGETEQFLISQARRHNAWLVGSIAQFSGEQTPEGTPRAVNVAVLAGPNGQLHRYRKIHPFSYAREHEHYDAGTGFLNVDLDGLRVTVFICYDLRFADEFWQCAEGTDLYVVPANWPEPRREHWRALLRARAIENQAYVIGCNRVGRAGTLNHLGDSVILDPLGRALSEASVGETVLVADVDRAEVARVRERFPFLQDRR